MAITAYIGINGSGKSYECVSSVIVNGVLSGRRVITNIVGIQPELIREYCLKQRKGITLDDLGEVISVTDEQCLQEAFLAYKGEEGKCTTHTTVLAGDLVVLDELWRLFGSGKKLTQKQESFFAEHRHFTHEKTGVSCDFVFMSQELSGVSRFIRDRIDKTFRMKKLNAIGLNRNYRVDIYDGHKLIKAALISSYQRRYNAKVFPLYKSHDGQNGVEVVVDKRQSLLNGRFLMFRLVVPVILGLVGFFVLRHLYLQYTGNVSPDTAATQTVASSTNTPTTNAAYDRLTQPNAAENYQQVQPLSDYRIAGRLARRGREYVILQNTAGQLRFEPISLFTNEDGFLSGVIDGQTVSFYSGK